MNSPFYKKAVLEKDAEAEGNEYAARRGWLEYKITSPSVNGLPDRFYARRGVVVFGEWKKTDGTGEVSPQQRRRHKELRAHGIAVYVFDDIEHFKKVMR